MHLVANGALGNIWNRQRLLNFMRFLDPSVVDCGWLCMHAPAQHAPTTCCTHAQAVADTQASQQSPSSTKIEPIYYQRATWRLDRFVKWRYLPSDSIQQHLEPCKTNQAVLTKSKFVGGVWVTHISMSLLLVLFWPHISYLLLRMLLMKTLGNFVYLWGATERVWWDTSAVVPSINQETKDARCALHAVYSIQYAMNASHQKSRRELIHANWRKTYLTTPNLSWVYGRANSGI